MSDRPQNPLPEAYRVLLCRYMTAQEVADWWQIDVKTVYAYVQRGILPYVRIGTSVRFVQWQLLEWVVERNFRPRPRRREEGS